MRTFIIVIVVGLAFLGGAEFGGYLHHAYVEDQEWTCEEVPDPTSADTWVVRVVRR